MRASVFLLLFAAFAGGHSAREDSIKVTKETFTSEGRTRTYYLYAPETLGTGTLSPLIVCLHGSGRNGLSLVDKWKDLAKKEGIILAGLDSVNPQEWNSNVDGPNVIRDLVETVAGQHAVDRKRVYLFGHSGGAIQGLMLALLESQYFAAAAVHAGALPRDSYNYGEYAVRKIPLAIWVGTNDRFFPVAAVRATRDALALNGLTVQLTEITGHTHDYYTWASDINKGVWAFLKSKALESDPVFTPYQIR